MKATGIVRRIDELGRIVIPKEIRRTFNIREGTPLEIFCGENNELVLKKYSMINELKDFATDVCQATFDTLACPVIICDKDSFVAYSGFQKNLFLDKTISQKLFRHIDNRKDILKNKQDGDLMIELFDGDTTDYSSQIVVPIMSSGDTYGAIICYKTSQNKLSQTELQVLKVMSNFLAEQIG